MVKRFRTRPVEIEAIQFDGENHDELEEWTQGNWDSDEPWNMFGDDDFEYKAQVFDILHDTWIQVKPGQWIVKGAKGEYYPCDDETFHWKYEEVSAQEPSRAGGLVKPFKAVG